MASFLFGGFCDFVHYMQGFYGICMDKLTEKSEMAKEYERGKRPKTRENERLSGAKLKK